MADLPGWLVWAGGAVVVGAVLWAVRTLVRRWRKSRRATYGHEVRTFDLEHDGEIRYARWLHPKEKPKSFVQQDVDRLRRFVRPGDLVVDVGAHTGDTAIPLGLASGPAGCCLALEPNPHVFEVLEKNADLNRDKANIVALNFAATETDGTFTFHYSDGGFCNGGFLSQIHSRRHGHRQALEVRGRNLEAFLRREYADRLDRLSYVKIDTEGYDRQVLRSILGILGQYRPVIVCEVLRWLDRGERRALYDVLDGAGYDCYLGAEGHDPRGERIDRESMMRWPQFDILALPRAVGQARSVEAG